MSIAKRLLEFINSSPISYYAVENLKGILKGKEFVELKANEKWKLKIGGKYFYTTNDSSIIAFSIGEDTSRFNVIGSHSDSPGFRIKSKPIIKRGSMALLNTEIYGGPIVNTWLDRPLGIAGRVVVKSNDPFKPIVKLVDFNRDLLIIPNLAIHMNREINKGVELNPQIHTLPVISTDEEIEEDYFEKLLAYTFSVDEKEILDYDLYLYDRNPGCFIGAKEEFISVGRLDNLAMAYLSVAALDLGSGINLAIITDNEEVGSSTIQGANSPMIESTFERIFMALGKSREELYIAYDNSTMLSADMAHGIHPNYLEMADPTNRPELGKGPVIKYAANKAYTSDGISASIFKGLCEKSGVPCQTFYNRSDKKGGSTIGPITSGRVPIKGVDIGCAMLSMHSIRELAHTDDMEYMYKVFKEFYR